MSGSTVDIYGTIRAAQRRLQELQLRASELEPSQGRTVLVETLDTLVILAREASTLAHHVRLTQERLSDIVTTIQLLTEEVFGPAKGEQ